MEIVEELLRKEDELRFWRNYLSKSSNSKQKIKQLRPYIVELIGDKKEVDILDLGSGPMSTIGYILQVVKVNLILADMLADEYNTLIKELNIQTPILIDKQFMENLSYADESFDIVHCHNALDHCFDPLSTLYE